MKYNPGHSFFIIIVNEISEHELNRLQFRNEYLDMAEFRFDVLLLLLWHIHVDVDAMTLRYKLCMYTQVETLPPLAFD